MFVHFAFAISREIHAWQNSGNVEVWNQISNRPDSKFYFLKQTLTSQYIFDLLRKTLQQSNLLSKSLEKTVAEASSPVKLKTPPYFSDEKKSSRTEWFRFQKNEIISGKMHFYFNTTSYEKQKLATDQWFFASVALSFPQFT